MSCRCVKKANKMKQSLPPESWQLERKWTNTPDKRRYVLCVKLAGMEVAHGWELVALDDIEAANIRDEGDEGPTGEGWYLSVPGHDLSPGVFTPISLPVSPLLNVIMEEYALKLKFLSDEPMPDHQGRRPRRRYMFRTDNEPPCWVEAADCLKGVLIDPVLPERASDGPLGLTPEETEIWIGRPYILSSTLHEKLDLYSGVMLSFYPIEYVDRELEAWARKQRFLFPDGVSYQVECLEWGVLDRPQDWGVFATLEEAVECARTGPPWLRGVGG